MAQHTLEKLCNVMPNRLENERIPAPPSPMKILAYTHTHTPKNLRQTLPVQFG